MIDATGRFTLEIMDCNSIKGLKSIVESLKEVTLVFKNCMSSLQQSTLIEACNIKMLAFEVTGEWSNSY